MPQLKAVPLGTTKQAFTPTGWLEKIKSWFGYGRYMVQVGITAADSQIGKLGHTTKAWSKAEAEKAAVAAIMPMIGVSDLHASEMKPNDWKALRKSQSKESSIKINK